MVSRYQHILVTELGEAEWQAWDNLHALQPFASPFTHPQFTRCLSHVRPKDTYVAIAHNNGCIEGFLPFQQLTKRSIAPVAELLNDYQAPIIKPHSQWKADDWWRSTSCHWYSYNHMPNQHQGFLRYSPISTTSPIIDTTGPYEHYLDLLKSYRGKLPSSLTRTDKSKRNKLVSEVGEIQFIADCHDEAVYQELILHKRKQYVQTGANDIFATSWIVEFLDILRQQQDENFKGRLSVLMAADKPVAMHFGIATPPVWHYWFPTYNDDFGSYSVGILLLIEMIKTAGSETTQCIDLGRGDQRYKVEMKTGEYGLLEGALAHPQWRASWHFNKRQMVQRAKASKFAQLIKQRVLHR